MKTFKVYIANNSRELAKFVDSLQLLPGDIEAILRDEDGYKLFCWIIE